MKLSPDFKEFIELLNANEVKYLVVGGYAVGLHGYPRLTKDIDFWIQRDNNNAQLLLETLQDFGLGSLQFTAEDFLNANNIIQLGVPPNRIDIITDLENLSFDECFETRAKIDAQGVIANVLDLESLKKNKKSTGRLQDLADAEKLETKGKKKNRWK